MAALPFLQVKSYPIVLYWTRQGPLLIKQECTSPSFYNRWPYFLMCNSVHKGEIHRFFVRCSRCCNCTIMNKPDGKLVNLTTINKSYVLRIYYLVDVLWGQPIKLIQAASTLTSLIKGHARLFFSRKKSSLPSDFHVIDWKFHPTR